MRCLVCDSVETKPYLSLKTHQYSKCFQCGCAFQTQISTTNQVDFHKGPKYKLGRLLAESQDIALYTWQIELMKRYSPKGKILEVGCSSGFFLKTASKAGYEVLGIDLGDENVIFGQYFLGVTILNRDFLQLDNSVQFDWIVMNQLIEHVTDPRAFIRKARSLLNPNGHFLITTPNLICAERLVKWPRWFGLRPIIIDAFVHPNHCVLFRPDTLKKILTQEGFVNVKTGYNPTGFVSGDRHKIRRLIAKFIVRYAPEMNGPNFYAVAKKL